MSLAEPARRAAIAAMLMIGAILAGYVYFASLYLQKVLGFSPVATGLALVPSTVTVVLVSTLGTRRLLARFSIKAVLLAGLACMGAGQLWLAQITMGASYSAAVLPGLVLTAAGVGLALPTASIAITSGVQASDQGLAGALFTTGQQTGAAVGLAILATAAAAATAFVVFRWTMTGDAGKATNEMVLVLGRSDAHDAYTALYQDERGVCRAYATAFDGSHWT
jgi:MFS family permease